VNVLSREKQRDIEALVRAGLSFTKIGERLGVDRRSVASYAHKAGLGKKQNVPFQEGVATGSERENVPVATGSEVAKSNCECHREWIEEQVRLGRNAVAIWQELVDRFAFKSAYNSVKRFVGKLKTVAPEQFDILEAIPGEEAQVDYGQGAPTLFEKTGKYRRPRLFVMTLKFSRRSFRKVVWASSQEVWARLHEEGFRYFGGVPQYVVLDNLKEGVLKPNIYEPELNPVYVQLLGHYGCVADPARVADPDRKGVVEKAIDHTQSTALKGKKFDSIEEQNTFLMGWEERWAAKRIHGRAKRQVEEMFLEEKKVLKSLPLENFRFFKQAVRTVAPDGLIEVERSYYFAHATLIGLQIPVRIFEYKIEILDPKTLLVIRRHDKNQRPGQFSIRNDERIFNPSRETEALLKKAAKIGEATHAFASFVLTEEGRVARRKLYHLLSLAKKYSGANIEDACKTALERANYRVQTIARLIENKIQQTQEIKNQAQEELVQDHELIRPSSEYQSFFETYSQNQ
jgi:transposase